MQVVQEQGPRTPEVDELLVRATLKLRAEARADPAVFFSMVMREEFTRAPIECLPHQRVLFDFVTSHPRSVIRMPVGTSKTYSMAALTMWLLGLDPTERGAIISSTQGMAAKPLGMVRDYIENRTGDHAALRLVFPLLRKSVRDSDSWTQHKITVDRPSGIRDPSLTAVGIGGSLPGSRLSWILVDDILDQENTRTHEGRMNVRRWINSTVLSRRDVRGSRIVVCNTPWHPEDVTYALEKAGWPTLTMDIEGGVFVSNTDWDSDEIRPAYLTHGACHRLSAHDSPKYGAPAVVELASGEHVPMPKSGRPAGRIVHFDVDERVPLWPEKFGRKEIDRIRDDYVGAMHEYNQLYMSTCRDDGESRVKIDWIENCKKLARAAGHMRPVSEYRGPNLTVTGVDLAIGQGKSSDDTALFTFELVPRIEVGGVTHKMVRRILDVEVGKFAGRDIVEKIKDKARRYNSLIRVETNAAQDFIRQWVLETDVSIPVRAHVTGANKHHRAHGVEGLFIELANGAWLIPNDERGACHPGVQRWIDECLYYQPPPAHTGDVLIASWLAREEARYIGVSDEEGNAPGLGASVMAR